MCPRIVIVGAGFGGLWAARTLAGSQADVLLIDRNNYHTFLPLLYQVAAAELEPEQIIYPIRTILRKLPNTEFIMAEVTGLNIASHTIEADGSIIPYDYLILAMGSTSHYFGVPGAAQYTFPLKTLEHGTSIRNHVLCRFERAVYETDAEARQRILTFAIVGGGATGVEFAGALAELIRGPLVKDYPQIDFTKVKILLLEAADSLIPMMPDRSRRYAIERLKRMGVDVRLKTEVSRIEPDAVYLKSGEAIPTETVVWTAGVRGEPIAQAWGLPVARAGRVSLLPTLQLPEHPNVYVVGDLAYEEEDGRPLPMVAPVAVQQGIAAAKNIMLQLSEKKPQPFRYRDRGTMVTIGRNAAVAQVGGRDFVGFSAWLLWLIVHLLNLIGFRNRILVMINWAWYYFLFEHAVRFIFPSHGPGAAKCSSRGQVDIDNRS
ncbi:MAG: NAD(P)/FAD-dependent oxidoreductase [Firmicutes bacterium]|nr:NAD(P)/FAD-dependent oxidoreductase [Bacillota bacterium]